MNILLTRYLDLSAFILKIIAMISMTFDHTGYIIFGGVSFFNYIGRLAFPIFAFQIAQGYIHTKNFKKYLSRLAIFAFISQIPFMLFRYAASNTMVSIPEIPSTIYNAIIALDFTLNIFFTLTIGLIAIWAYDKIKYKFAGLLVGISLAYLAEFISTDYGFYGVAIILLFYIFKDSKILMPVSFTIATIAFYIHRIYPIYVDYYIKKVIDISLYLNREILLCFFTIVPIFFISLYNGKKGRNTKYLLYLFYPIHLLLIYLSYLFLHN